MERIILILLIAGSAFAQSGGQPIPIPIQNPSFEQVTGPLPTVQQCGNFGWDGQGDFHIPGWKWGANAGVFQATNQPCGPSQAAYPPPDGILVAYAGYGGTFSQDLGVKASDLQAISRDGLYTLTFSIANYFGVYPGGYEASLKLGVPQPDGTYKNVQTLCSKDNAWAMQLFKTDTLVCFSPGYFVFDETFADDGSPATPADHNAHLFLTFTGYGWTVLFDKVSMTFSPD